MAENKSSFVLYADQIGIFSELTDEKAGQLIKHIFKYVNDQNPETEDSIIRIAFAPIKLQLKRDLKKYEARCAKNKQNIMKRWNEKNTNEYDGIGTNTKHTDNDTDNENDTDNDTDIIKKGRFFKLIPKKFENNEEFWKAWKDWFDHNSYRGTEITPAQAKVQFEYLENYSEPIELLKQALANDWKGIIYKEKTSGNQQTTFEPKIYTHEELRDMYFKQGYFTQNSKKGDPIAENYMMIDTGYEYPMYILKSQFNSEKHKVWNKNKTDVKKEAAEIRASEAKEEKDMILDQWKRFKNLDKELSKKEKEEFNEAMKKKNYIKSENLLLSKEGKKTEKTIEPKTIKDFANAITV